MPKNTEQVTWYRIFCPRKSAGPYGWTRCGFLARAPLTPAELSARLAEPCPTCKRVGLDAVEEQ